MPQSNSNKDSEWNQFSFFSFDPWPIPSFKFFCVECLLNPCTCTEDDVLGNYWLFIELPKLLREDPNAPQ